MNNSVFVRLDLTPGTKYEYTPTSLLNGQVGRWVQGKYRVLGVAKEVRSVQQLVVYEGVGEPDDGKWFVCSLSDFATRFTLVEPPAPEVRQHNGGIRPAEPLAEKSAGHITEGTGA